MATDIEKLRLERIKKNILSQRGQDTPKWSREKKRISLIKEDILSRKHQDNPRNPILDKIDAMRSKDSKRDTSTLDALVLFYKFFGEEPNLKPTLMRNKKDKISVLKIMQGNTIKRLIRFSNLIDLEASLLEASDTLLS